MRWVRLLVPQGVKNAYHYLQAAIASFINGNPSKKLIVIGVTGTDGKTTTVNLLYHILKSSGYRVSMISTVKAVVGAIEYDTGFHVTTPNSFKLQNLIKKMVQAGSEILILEVTSHALDQNRVAFLNFDQAIITNISYEHLDYHKNYESYVRAKSKLLNNVKFRILNMDDGSFDYLSSKGSGKMISYGRREKADLVASDVSERVRGLQFKIKTKGKNDETFEVFYPYIGQFNVYNILAVVACAKTFGVETTKIKEYLKNFKGVEGRLEEIDEGQNFDVIVDFAHTPNAFLNILMTLKNRTRKNLICVFGSAGERDVNKRPAMGEIAGRVCDYNIVTGEDPRYEDVNKIIEDISIGLKRSGGIQNQNFWLVPDRAQAIREAVQNMAKEGDTVVILGKGHEKSMNIGGTEYPWSDQMAVRNALSWRLKK
ncbi:UDP-N-acetylmuramoyl-L-alanyl-D-glutamate--2,6-diaminopimelate ligase [Patescibacteria group bacterium]|nr:UDP-N-acetylmuramoyl-L-alanyl-D-glutamate--2,6-diaminopimelate ligase [Patescibacteria group bacterium]